MGSESLTDEALDAAVIAYDEARCSMHMAWHRSTCAPMSPANRDSIRPMIREAVLAAMKVAATRAALEEKGDT